MDRTTTLKTAVRLLFVFLLVASCDSSVDITQDMLDSTSIYDPSINDPQDYLLSYSKPTPTPAEATTPVFIAIHGYSATTFEWEEFRTWSAITPDYFISMVLLGGHGTTYDDFKNASWKDWQKSITDEYERLVDAGYTNINFLGSSTSCTLIIDLLSRGYFNDLVIPRNILFIDPIVIPSSKILSLVPLLGPILGYVEADNTSEEDRYWYHYRPQETLQELNAVITSVRKQLEKGITLPPNCSLKVYKSIKDTTADPVSAVLIYKGIRASNNAPIEVEMVDSKLHVYTRLDLRTDLSGKDLQNQEDTFTDLSLRVR